MALLVLNLPPVKVGIKATLVVLLAMSTPVNTITLIPLSTKYLVSKTKEINLLLLLPILNKLTHFGHNDPKLLIQPIPAKLVGI